MFDMVDPCDDGGWDSFVPPVPPPDDETDTDADAHVHVGGLDPRLELQAAQAMAEFEQACEAVRRDELDADATLVEVAGSRVTVNLVLVEQLLLAAHWADLHRVLTDTRTLPGGERLVPVGGDGTPQIAEFAQVELAAMLRVSDTTAARLIGDALDLRHRFPLLWSRVQTGEVDVWLARKTVQQARSLSKDAAARVDGRVAHLAGSLTWGRLRKVVEKAILEADPPQALCDAEQAAAEAGVWRSEQTEHGYGSMFIKAAAGDLRALDEALDVISRALKILGDTRDPQQRRATAVGIIATPQTAHELIARAEQVRTLQLEAAAAQRAGDHAAADRIDQSVADLMLPDPTPTDPTSAGQGSRCDRRPLTFNTAILYYHLSKQTLDSILNGEPDAGAAVMRMEDLGPVIADQVRRWLHHSNVVLKPVIDLAGTPPVDHYEVPGRISEVIGLRRQADYFPYADSLSRHQENEHTVAYIPMDEGGPPGQTDPAKMAKISKFHHRIKTHSGWTVHQLGPQHWCWRSPHGYTFLEGPHGTTALGKLGKH